MTAGVAVVLIVLAALDAAFAGFRASAGRSGLIDHRAADRRGARRGLAMGALALLVPAAVIGLDCAVRPDRLALWRTAGTGLLAVTGVYGAIVLAALAVYLLLPWRWRYLASALVLGPFTLARPFVVLAGAATAVAVAPDVLVIVVVLAAASAVLVVEPVCERRWYDKHGTTGRCHVNWMTRPSCRARSAAQTTWWE